MRKKINPFWMTLSVLLSFAILVLCVIARRGGILYLQPDGEPQEVVTQFFDSILAGDYASAYACLSDYSGLGLENEPSDASGRTLYQALRQSYAYTLRGDCAVDRLSAVQRLELRYLDVKAVETEIASRVEGITERLVAERPGYEIYDEDNGGYLESFTDEVYIAALDEVLANASNYYSTTELEIPLQYTGGSWKMQTSPALFKALLGNI